jgi:hypothetical protein
MDNAAPTAGDWAQYEYRGYGFRLFLRRGPAFGKCQVNVDGVAQGAPIDCYSAALGQFLALEVPNLPLDYHRVQVVCTAAKNASASAAGISWLRLQVMR